MDQKRPEQELSDEPTKVSKDGKDTAKDTAASSGGLIVEPTPSGSDKDFEKQLTKKPT